MIKLEKKYQKIWELAKPYYERGRIYDIPQIEWMLSVIDEVCQGEDLDKNFLIPLILLHDIGYADIDDKNPNCKSEELKRMHMKKGAQIAAQILEQVGYDRKESEKIIAAIRVHDNWVFGDNDPYKLSGELAVFTDLDFMFPAQSITIFKQRAEALNEDVQGSFENFINDEKLINRPLATMGTKRLFEKLALRLRKEIYDRT